MKHTEHYGAVTDKYDLRANAILGMTAPHLWRTPPLQRDSGHAWSRCHA